MYFKTKWGEKAYWLNEIISHLNDERAYAGSWLYIWPDGTDASDVDDYFDNEESYKELEDLFIKLYKAYHRDGLYSFHGISRKLLDKAHEWDKKLGLPEITDVSKQRMPIAQDAMEEEIVKILNEVGITDFELDEEADTDYPEEPYKCIYFEDDEDAKKGYRALKKSGKWPNVKAIKDFWGREGYSDIEVLVSNFAEEPEEIEEALLTEATAVSTGSTALSTTVQDLCKDGRFTEAWQEAKKEEEEQGEDAVKGVLYVSGSKFGDGYLSVKDGAINKTTNYDQKVAIFWKRLKQGLKIDRKANTSGRWYICPRSDINSSNVDEVAIFPLSEINEVKRLLQQEAKPASIRVLGIPEFYRDVNVPVPVLNFRDQVLNLYISDYLGTAKGLKKIGTLQDPKNPSQLNTTLTNIKLPLYRIIDTYGLTDNAFLDFLGKYAEYVDTGDPINKGKPWSAENFAKITNLVVATGKASILREVDKTESPSRLLLNPNLYLQSQDAFYQVFRLFSHYWTNGYQIEANKNLNTENKDKLKHNLAGAIIFEKSNIEDIITEKSDARPTDYDDNAFITLEIRPWEAIKNINQKLINLEDTGNPEDQKAPEKTRQPSKGPKNTQKIDISELNRTAYKKTTPETGYDDGEYRRDVILDKGDVFMGTDGEWYVAGAHGNYVIKAGSDVYLKTINVKDFGGYDIGELATMDKQDRDAVISSLEPREQNYLKGIFK